MAFLEWTPSLSVHVPELDEEHQKWFGFINKLHDGVEEGRGQEELQALLDDVIAFSRIHFKHEEEIFDRSSYPDAAYHRQLHEGYLNELLSYKERIRVAAYKDATYDVLFLLKKWLIEHVQEVDHQYIPYITD